ncbi:unnamed protein product, partial [Urochloa humidicola]
VSPVVFLLISVSRNSGGGNQRSFFLTKKKKETREASSTTPCLRASQSPCSAAVSPSSRPPRTPTSTPDSSLPSPATCARALRQARAPPPPVDWWGKSVDGLGLDFCARLLPAAALRREGLLQARCRVPCCCSPAPGELPPSRAQRGAGGRPSQRRWAQPRGRRRDREGGGGGDARSAASQRRRASGGGGSRTAGADRADRRRAGPPPDRRHLRLSQITVIFHQGRHFHSLDRAVARSSSLAVNLVCQARLSLSSPSSSRGVIETC